MQYSSQRTECEHVGNNNLNVMCLSLQEHVWDASHYLVRLVFSGLKEMFTGTREIQVGSKHLHKAKYIRFYPRIINFI